MASLLTTCCAGTMACTRTATIWTLVMTFVSLGLTRLQKTSLATRLRPYLLQVQWTLTQLEPRIPLLASLLLHLKLIQRRHRPKLLHKSPVPTMLRLQLQQHMILNSQKQRPSRTKSRIVQLVPVVHCIQISFHRSFRLNRKPRSCVERCILSFRYPVSNRRQMPAKSESESIVEGKGQTRMGLKVYPVCAETRPKGSCPLQWQLPIWQHS